jgi:hypothetical protein
MPTEVVDRGQRIQAFLDPEVFSTDEAAMEAVTSAGATYVEKLSYFCPSNRCTALVSGTGELVVVDKHHLTPTAARAFGEQVSVGDGYWSVG